MATAIIHRPAPAVRPLRRGTCLGQRNPDCTANVHGTASAYKRGCRCPHARDAHRIYHKRLREGRNQPKLIDATGTHRRIQALWALGHNSTTIGAVVGLTEHHVQRIVWARDYVTHHTWHLIDRAFRELSTVPGTSGHTRRRAQRAGYPPPLAWDDIDDPNEQPQLGDPNADVIDEVAVQRALNGERVPLTRAERDHAFRVGLARGLTPYAIGNALHLSGRTAQEIAARVTAQAA